MEFLYQNYINTTTQIAVSSNTATSENLFNSDRFYQYYTDGYNSDSLTASITITFDATTNISRIALIEHNLKDFTIYYNGATANTFALTSGDTTASNYTSNSSTSHYFRFNTIAVSSVTIDMKKTITANQEKVVAYFGISDLILSMSQLPESGGYKPRITPKQIVHRLSDGGTRIHNIKKKYNISINIDYIPSDLRDSLHDIYSQLNPFIFCPFGTTTAWDAIFFEAVWPGEFEFYEFSENATASGFSGSIRLAETPS